MSTDYKIDVVRSLVGVLQNYPTKFSAVNAFLLELLRKEKQFEIKSEIIKVFAYEIT
jgi:tRNA U55 pseudouridine synthase TruB